MIFLDMTPYRPYRSMGRSCLPRPMRDKQVLWVRGWRIAGIFPGNFRRWNGDNQEYGACERAV
jgi:hypothetical protein